MSILDINQLYKYNKYQVIASIIYTCLAVLGIYYLKYTDNSIAYFFLVIIMTPLFAFFFKTIITGRLAVNSSAQYGGYNPELIVGTRARILAIVIIFLFLFAFSSLFESNIFISNSIALSNGVAIIIGVLLFLPFIKYSPISKSDNVVAVSNLSKTDAIYYRIVFFIIFGLLSPFGVGLLLELLKNIEFTQLSKYIMLGLWILLGFFIGKRLFRAKLN